MVFDLQRAGTWKRMAAWLFDSIITGILAVGIGFLLSLLLGYDSYSETVDAAYAKYEAEYGMVFEISQSEYEAMTETEKQNYEAAYQALTADTEAMYAYNMMLNLSLLIISLGILTAILVWEFLLPLRFGNGQTLGKKIFGLCLISNDGVRVNSMQLFVRSLLGKFTIETMIPVYIVMMVFWGTMGLTGTVILLGIFVAQLCCVGISRNRTAIHDLLVGTIVVDYASQMIFPSTEQLIAYQKQVAAENAARQSY